MEHFRKKFWQISKWLILTLKSHQDNYLCHTKICKSIPKPQFWALLWVLWAQHSNCIQQIQWKNSTLIHKNVQKYLLLVLWAQTPICMGPINLKMGLSSNVCLRSNRFNGKKMTKYPKILFLSTFMGFMGPKPHFYGFHKP